jgi:hypothetical protein
MKQEELNKVDPLKNWIKEAGMETLGPEFHISVLKKIEAMPKVNSSYTPVISSFGWKVILGLIALVFTGSLIFIPADADSPSLFDKIPAVQLPKFNLTLPTLDFSPPFFLSLIAFFILGFIMIVGTIRNNKVGI